MAIKPTIFKLKINLSDMDRHCYETLNLTVAQHPSETLERMMVRVLAFCINAQENLEFSKGLSMPDEPDLWAHSLDDQLLLWIDVGEPSVDRIKKATRQAQQVKIYSFNTKSDVWWKQSQQGFSTLNVQVFQFQWAHVQTLAGFVQRTMDLSVMVSGDSIYIATNQGECEVLRLPLQAP